MFLVRVFEVHHTDSKIFPEHTCFCVTGSFFRNYSRLGRSSKVKFWELLWQMHFLSPSQQHRCTETTQWHQVNLIMNKYADLEFSRLEFWSRDVSRLNFESLGLGLGLDA